MTRLLLVLLALASSALASAEKLTRWQTVDSELILPIHTSDSTNAESYLFDYVFYTSEIMRYVVTAQATLINSDGAHWWEEANELYGKLDTSVKLGDVRWLWPETQRKEYERLVVELRNATIDYLREWSYYNQISQFKQDLPKSEYLNQLGEEATRRFKSASDNYSKAETGLFGFAVGKTWYSNVIFDLPRIMEGRKEKPSDCHFFYAVMLSRLSDYNFLPDAKSIVCRLAWARLKNEEGVEEALSDVVISEAKIGDSNGLSFSKIDNWWNLFKQCLDLTTGKLKPTQIRTAVGKVYWLFPRAR